MLIGVLYIAFIMITMYLVVRDMKYPKLPKEVTKKIPVSSKYKKVAIIIVLCTYLFYYLIGNLLKTDMPIAFTLNKNGSSISFIGLFLLFVTSVLVGHIFDAVKKKTHKKKNN